MATNVTGIAIVIKGFLPTGKTLDEQFAALSLVKDAHASSDYSKLLAAAQIDEVKTEQKTRRMEDAPAEPEAEEPAVTVAEIKPGDDEIVASANPADEDILDAPIEDEPKSKRK